MPIPMTQTPNRYPLPLPPSGSSTPNYSPPGPAGPRALRPQSCPQPPVSMPMPEPQIPQGAERQANEYEDDDLALALVLSAQAVNEQSRQAAEEEEELMRALAESARLDEERKQLSAFTDIRPDDWGEGGGSTSRRASFQVGQAGSSAIPLDLEQQMREDEALARRLQMEAEEEERSAQSSHSHQPDVDDEAFVRQLVAEEEAQAALKDQESRPASVSDASPEVHDLPAYSRAPTVPRMTKPNVLHDATHLGRSQSAGVIPTVRAEVPLLYPTAVRSMSVGPLPPRIAALPPPSLSPSPETSPAFPVPDPMASVSSSIARPSSPSRLSYVSVGSALTSVEEESIPSASRSESALVPPPAPLVEPEYLMGVSMGFHIPSITPELHPMQEPLQNVITLPYGKASPYHIQAQSWRHLLKLMVRMRTSRIEPSIEAMALKQEDLKLRAVVQFVRVHHRSTEWRTILYLTLDYPVPQTQAGGWKYVNGDVNTLPYSYTLSSLPALLRDGADSSMAKSYTIPLAPMTPFPTLPITLPNMALYLQSALDESRKAMSDSSSGMRKLAQLVDSCYPEEMTVYEESDMPERKGVKYRLRKVFGKKESRERGGNEDVYELITPFVLDEQG
ncbi:hypothetical protein OE88DRAFT_1731528 [Heliocybe sulcata]|uniref:Uncharacterized protein n=1 Tax=Heliocybe sulcata TaxID=5364 RepID=A0A5C3NEV7_9AGAM|nr:hypothetical protein OE88DRAFT_1731528 [Heliocybe sulcata]